MYSEFSQFDHRVNKAFTPDLSINISIELLLNLTRVLVGITGFLDFVHHSVS
jgi:hypothetical protein